MALLAMAADLAHGGVLAGEAIVAEDDAGIPLAGLAVFLTFCAGWMDLVTYAQGRKLAPNEQGLKAWELTCISCACGGNSSSRGDRASS